jgi:predicted ArsR family transcriptional regulator
MTAPDPARRGSAHGEVTVSLPVPANRRAVLVAVRRHGDATAEQVAADLDITVSGARQHLSALLDLGLLAASDTPRPAGERGRPRLAYHTTELADAVFPKAYAALTTELLGYLDEESPDAVERLFRRRRNERLDRAKPRIEARRTLGAKVDELARILDEDGYLATAERVARNRYRIVEHNCAIAAVAGRYGQACTSEIDFIRAVLPGTTVTRTHHMVAGDRHCGYEITSP